MNNRYLAPLMVVLAGLFPAFTAPASAHIVLSQPSFEAGQNYAAFFKVENGCGGSPTIALRVEIPQSVSVLNTPAQPETLYFPAIQSCEKGEARWVEFPTAGQASHDAAHPAPPLQLIAAVATAPAPSQYMAGDIMIMQPWGPATPGGATTAAGYMTIMNHGSTPDTLLGGTSPAGKLEVHQMTMTNGIMTMRPVAGGLTIPGGGVVTLQPQGPYHLMLTGLKAPLAEGTRVPATLNFAKTGPVQIEFAIAPIGARTPSAEHH